jgi:hypothetical protein
MKMKLFVIALIMATTANCSSTFTSNLTAQKTNGGTPKMEIYSDGRQASFFAGMAIFPVTILATELFDTDPGAYLTGQRCAYQLCTTITLCDKQTHTCQKIDHILVDTSITGLHIFNSALSSKLKKLISQERYVKMSKYEDGDIKDCVETSDGAIDGYVAPVVAKYGNMVSKTNAQIVTRFGNKTNCSNYVLNGSGDRRNNDRGMLWERERGINGILGLGISTKVQGHEDNYLYNGGTIDDVYDYPLIQPLSGAKNFVIKVPNPGETGYIKFIKCNDKTLVPTHKHAWTFDTGNPSAYISNEQVKVDNDNQKKDIIAQLHDPTEIVTGIDPATQGNFGFDGIVSDFSTSYYEPEPYWTKGLGDLAGKTLTFTTVHGQRYVKVGNDVYKSNY